MIHAEAISTAKPIYTSDWGGDSMRGRVTSKEAAIAIDLDARIVILRPIGRGTKVTVPLENITSWTDLPEPKPAPAPLSSPPPAQTPAPTPVAAQVAPKPIAPPVSPSPAPSPPATAQSASVPTAKPAAPQPEPKASRSTRRPR